MTLISLMLTFPYTFPNRRYLICCERKKTILHTKTILHSPLATSLNVINDETNAIIWSLKLKLIRNGEFSSLIHCDRKGNLWWWLDEVIRSRRCVVFCHNCQNVWLMQRQGGIRRSRVNLLRPCHILRLDFVILQFNSRWKGAQIEMGSSSSIWHQQEYKRLGRRTDGEAGGRNINRKLEKVRRMTRNEIVER